VGVKWLIHTRTSTLNNCSLSESGVFYSLLLQWQPLAVLVDTDITRLCVCVYVGLERSYAAEVNADTGWSRVPGGQVSGVRAATQASCSPARSWGTHGTSSSPQALSIMQRSYLFIYTVVCTTDTHSHSNSLLLAPVFRAYIAYSH